MNTAGARLAYCGLRTEVCEATYPLTDQAQNFRRRAVDKVIKFFVALNVHKDGMSIAVYEPGRDFGQFVGTIQHDVLALLKVLCKYSKSAQVSANKINALLTTDT